MNKEEYDEIPEWAKYPKCPQGFTLDRAGGFNSTVGLHELSQAKNLVRNTVAYYKNTKSYRTDRDFNPIDSSIDISKRAEKRVVWLDVSEARELNYMSKQLFSKDRGDIMAFHDTYYSEYGDYSKIKKFYEGEVNVARCSHGVSLIMKDNGSMAFFREIDRFSNEAVRNKGVFQEDITYHPDGRIELDCSSIINLQGGMSYAINMLERFLPDSVHIYLANKKWMLTYKPGTNTRAVNYSSSYNPTEVYEIQDEILMLFPDGSVTGAKKIKRGEPKIAEDKPLKYHLEPKHYKEMAKSRLANDLTIHFDKKYATFRGTPTGLFHYCIELWNKSTQYNGAGPNTGLIRRLYVGRFQPRSEEGSMLDLAVSIVKDIPLSALDSDLKEAAEEARS